MWVEGNLPAGSKCTVCQRACGSLMKLQDFRCVWCKWTVSPDVPTFLPYYSGRCSRERKSTFFLAVREIVSAGTFYCGNINLWEFQLLNSHCYRNGEIFSLKRFHHTALCNIFSLQCVMCDVWCECVMWTCNPRSTPSARIRLKRRVRWEISNCPSCRRLLSSDLTPSGKECGRYIIIMYTVTL